MTENKQEYHGEEYFELVVGNLKRRLPIVGIADGLHIASFDILGDTELIEECGALLSTRMEPGFDIIMVPEAKAIALAHTISRIAGNSSRYIVTRKSKKAYFKDYISAPVKSITTAAEQRLYLNHTDVDEIRGKRVCLVDDVISTGSTISTSAELIKKAGGTLHQIITILLEGDVDTESLCALSVHPVLHLGTIPLFTDGA